MATSLAGHTYFSPRTKNTEKGLARETREHLTVAVGRPDNKQNRCKIGDELTSSIEKRFAISCYRKDVKKEWVNFCALQTQNLSYTIPQIGRLLELEMKCYLFHTLPGNRYNFIILKSIR